MATGIVSDEFAGMDDDTAILLVQLQLDDINDLLHTYRARGKYREGVATDVETAYLLEKAELERAFTVISDRKMSRSIARAVLSDAPLLAESATQERQAASDHQVAVGIEGTPARAERRASAAPQIVAGPADDLEEEFIQPLPEDLYLSTASVRYEEDAAETEAESSTSAARRQVANIERHECVICADEFVLYDLARLDCGHHSCRACLEVMFTMAIEHEDLYPPQCCGPILHQEKNVRLFMNPEIIKAFEKKKIEWDTKDRTYCANPNCCTFISPNPIVGNEISCIECGTNTCTFCKKLEHGGDCPEDENLRLAVQALADIGGRRCGTCQTGVELGIGCYHITCVCGSEFCYVCGEKWKICACPRWSEDLLLARANNIAAQNNVQVEGVLAQLRNQGECFHGQFRRTDGGICGDCGDYLRVYLWECWDCGIRVCNHCRY